MLALDSLEGSGCVMSMFGRLAQEITGVHWSFLCAPEVPSAAFADLLCLSRRAEQSMTR